jgi:hypothetical protein
MGDISLKQKVKVTLKQQLRMAVSHLILHLTAKVHVKLLIDNREKVTEKTYKYG